VLSVRDRSSVNGSAGNAGSSSGAATPVATLALAALAVIALIALLTPLLYTTWRPTWLPWELESYINGCHNLGAPQPWLFCIFPWTGFAFAGLAAGVILFSDWGRERTLTAVTWFAGVGAAAILIAYGFDHSSKHIYSVYDYWHSSPNFFMMRVGMLLMIILLAYGWCRWILASLGDWATRFSPIIQLGQASLLVYWVHIEFVYGRFSLLPKRAVGIPTATRGLIEIVVFMLVLAALRTRIDWKAMRLGVRARISQPAG
jgi:fucose 4-O-acetylase-like acetyltransferase